MVDLLGVLLAARWACKDYVGQERGGRCGNCKEEFALQCFERNAVTVRVSDNGTYVTCLAAWVSDLGIIISIPRIYLDIPIEYR